MKFTLDLPPSNNDTYYGAAGGGRLLLTDEAEAYKTEWGLRLNLIDVTPFRGKCVAWIHVYMRWPNRGDHHNYNPKLLLDILQGHAYRNDSQVVSLHIERCYDPKNPRVEIEVRQL